MKLIAILLFGCLALSACGGSDEDDPTSPSDGPSSASPEATDGPDPDPTVTTKPRENQRLTGVVEQGVEPNCQILIAGGTSYVLIGKVGQVAPGTRVTVKGRTDPDAMSTCQQGMVFMVDEITSD